MSNTKEVKKEPVKNQKKSENKEETKKTPAKRGRKPKKPEITLDEANAVYHVSLLAQATCVIGILAISILAIFEHSFTVPIEVLVGITLLIMAYNNKKMFKRQKLTIVYIIFGVISLIVGILGYFGVTI